MLKTPYEAKYQLLIKKPEDASLNDFCDSKAFIEHLNDMDGIYKNIEEYNHSKKYKILILFDYMIADIFSNKKLNPIVTELFISGRKLNISFVFITQSYVAVPKNVRLWEFQANENFNKLHLIIHQKLTVETL